MMWYDVCIDVMWYDVTDVTWNHNKKRPEWTILDAMNPQNNNHPQEWENNIVIEKYSGNLQVSGKQDTYYLEIKEDLSKFHCFSFKRITPCFPMRKSQEIEWQN